MANWGADFWGAYADVAKAQMAQAAFAQQQQGLKAFGRAMTDPNIFMPGGGGQPQGGGAPGDMSGYENAIASIESGGGRGRAPNYTAIGPRTKTGDRAYGRYQVMGNNIGPWTQEALGRRETPQQFLADPQAQNKVFDKRFGGYLQKTGSPQDAASMWFTGRPLAQGKNARDVNGMSGQSYADAFTKALGQTPQQVVGTASAIGGVPPGQLSWQHIVQAIQAKNPGLDPAALAEAVQMFEPLMSQQSQMDWREQSLQLREMSLQLAEQKASDVNTRAASKEAGVQSRFDTKEAGVQARFDATQDARYKGLQQRADEFKQKMAAAKTKSDRDYYARQRKANNDQRHQRAQEVIQRGSAMQDNPMSAEDQQKALDAENQRWQTENDQIDAEMAGSAPQQPYQQGDQHPVPKGAVRAPGVDTLGNKPAAGGDDTPPQSYLDGGGTAAGWKHMPKEKRSLWQ